MSSSREVNRVAARPTPEFEQAASVGEDRPKHFHRRMVHPGIDWVPNHDRVERRRESIKDIAHIVTRGQHVNHRPETVPRGAALESGSGRWNLALPVGVGSPTSYPRTRAWSRETAGAR